MITKCLTTKEDVADALEKVGFQANSSDFYDFTGEKLYARIIVMALGMQVHFSQKSTFDRWANSTNFVVVIDPKYPEVDFEKIVKQAEKICDSKVFDFNTYFHSIELS